MENKNVVDGLKFAKDFFNPSDKMVSDVMVAICGKCRGSHNDNAVLSIESARRIYQPTKNNDR